MLTLLIAVGFASLMGSFHCACMCGPIAIWTRGPANGLPRLELWKRLSGYHLGRLLTYLIIGTVAGLAGSAIGVLGQTAGVQSMAALIAGVAMMAIGIYRLRRALPFNADTQKATDESHKFHAPGQGRAGKRSPSEWIAGAVARLRPRFASLSTFTRSLAIGSTTVLLPCGWLYLFAIFAAGSGSVISSTAIMFAFWIGTVPALVALVTGVFQVVHASGRYSPKMASSLGAVLMILFGLHTATGRASADMRRLEQNMTEAIANTTHPPTTLIKEVSSQKLPCCHHE